MNFNKIELKQFYKEQIEKDFFPFWEKAFDDEFGGVFTCFNNQGTELISDDKYTWSQGRFLWLTSNLYRMVEESKLKLDKEKLKIMSEKTYSFLKENVFFDGYKSTYAMKKNGGQIEFNGIKDISIFADTFILISFNAFGRIFNNFEALDIANNVMLSIKERLDSGEYMTEPYPVNKEFEAHSIPMIMSNCYGECLETEQKTEFRYDLDLEALLEEQINKVLYKFTLDDNIVCELLTNNFQYKDTLLYRHVNPGHTIECMWFMLHGLDLLNEEKGLDKIVDIFNATHAIGWDKEYGGLFRFVDREVKGEPRGKLIHDKFEELIVNTWDYKLWWPHSELLYTSLLLYSKTDNEELLNIYKEAHEYAFKIFPNKDKEVGEWIQIRDRYGEPINEVVALPVKDPFHIIRNFILIIDLLDDME